MVPHEAAFGDAPRVLRDDGGCSGCLHPGFTLELFRDEAEGYYLNLSSGAPVWFVVWRIDDEDPARAWPETVSLSYNEAGRWLDAQERVDNVPLGPNLRRGCKATSMNTTDPSRSSGAVRSRSSHRGSAGERGGRRGFLSRWSRRKAQVAADGPNRPTRNRRSRRPFPRRSSPRPSACRRGRAEPRRSLGRRPRMRSRRPPVEPLPTMDDVARLTGQSDFSRFVRPGVDPGVRNAALKKLFSDPHFNVMDGLDTYIDDYGKPDPIPPSMLRRMTQSAVLGLFDADPPADARAIPGTNPRHCRSIPMAPCRARWHSPPTAQNRPPRRRPPKPAPMTTLICDCNKTMPLNGPALRQALGDDAGAGLETVHSTLCRREAGAFQRAAKGADDLLVACTQESRLFLALNDETEGAPGARGTADPLRQHPRDRRLVEGCARRPRRSSPR